MSKGNAETMRTTDNFSLNLTQSGPSYHRWVKSLSDTRFFVLVVILICSLTICVYVNSLNNEFTNWDDPEFVVDNVNIRSLSIDNLQSIFTPKVGSTFQPLWILSYAIDYNFWKLDPFGYHIVNTILHGLSAIVLYLVVLNALNQLRSEKFNKSNRIISLFTVLLFVVHPVNVESVTWICSRKYGLLAFFSFTAFYLFLRLDQKKDNNGIILVISSILVVLAMLSNPFAIVLPALFFLYDYCRDESNNIVAVLKGRFLYYLPYAAACVVVYPIIWRVLVVSDGSGTAKKHVLGNPLFTLLSMLQVFYDYLRNLIFPLWLNNRYVVDVSRSVYGYHVLISLVLIVMVGFFSFWQVKRKNKLPLFCFGWFFIGLLPVSNIIPISTKMADRYMYLPAISMFLGFSLLLGKLSEDLIGLGKPNLIPSLKILLLLFFSIATIRRNGVWQSSATLWADSLKKYEANSVAHLNLGNVLAKRDEIDQAIQHYLRAVELKPDFFKALCNVGSHFLERGELEKAIHYYSDALKINPDHAGAHFKLAEAFAEKGKLNEAIEHNLMAISLQPDYPMAHYNLGVLRQNQGNTSEAIEHYEQALKNQPDYAKAHVNIGVILHTNGEVAEAIRHYSAALRTAPELAAAHYNLAVALQDQGRTEEALDHLTENLRLNPDHIEAHIDIAAICVTQGDYSQATEHYLEVLEHTSENDDVHARLGFSLYKQGRIGDAILHCSEALAINPGNAVAHTNLGLIYHEGGDLAKAYKHYLQALESERDYAETHYNLGVLFGQQGDIEKSLKYYSQTLELDPEHEKAHCNLGVALHKLGRIREAVEHYAKAVELDGNYADAHNNLGRAYFQLGKLDKAIHHYSEALRIAQNYTTARTNLNEALKKKAETKP
jgi:protein O-mannosyl-transferase